MQRWINLCTSSAWPPGSVMIFKNFETGFQAMGLVVANDGRTLSVVWEERCFHHFAQYDPEHLNMRVIDRMRL